jgi:chromosome partitioning protein
MAGHIAVQAEIAGAGPVAIVDTDPQGSLADWWNERQEEYPAFAHTFVSRIGEDLNRLRELGIKTCVVDTPPAITTTIEHVIEVADLVVIPCRPSPHGIRDQRSDPASADHRGSGDRAVAAWHIGARDDPSPH